MFSERTTLRVQLFVIIFAVFASTAQAKSLYVISDTSASPSRLRAYEIDGTSLVYQTGYNCGTGSAVGLAIDESEYGDFLFVTFENRGEIHILRKSTIDIYPPQVRFTSSLDIGYLSAAGGLDISLSSVVKSTLVRRSLPACGGAESTID
jgi:hypothetical protein